jgi:integrase
MKGHIRERSPGRWAIILDAVDPATGTRKRKWHSFEGTKRQAQVECARLISEKSSGTYLEPSKLTLAQFFDHWLGHIKARVSPRSHERYGEIIHKNIVPALGNVPMTKLRPAQIAEAYTQALSAGRRDGAGGLSPNTVVYMHRLIKQALAHAVRWQMIIRNPADAVDPPKVERSAMTTYDMGQTAELLDGVRGTRLSVPVLLGVMCGLRRGEIAALRWRSVDLAGAQVAIVQSAEQTREGVRYKEPKSGRARTVALSAIVAEELRVHRLRQAEELLCIGIRQTDATFVYAREDGEPMQPRSLTHAWQQMVARTALPRVRFHDLRHAHATHMLSSGVHPKVASERLGHSKVGITLDLYSHVLPGMQADAAARVDDALRAAVEKRASLGHSVAKR